VDFDPRFAWLRAGSGGTIASMNPPRYQEWTLSGILQRIVKRFSAPVLTGPSRPGSSTGGPRPGTRWTSWSRPQAHRGFGCSWLSRVKGRPEAFTPPWGRSRGRI